MPPTVYLESTVISYLAARPSRDLLIAAHQQLTARWWNRRRNHFRCYISEIVIEEVGMGDPEAKAKRLALVDGIPLVDVTNEAREIAKRLLATRSIPETAKGDAAHIAIAAANGIDYLLTWNCRHIANAEMRPKIEACIEGFGYVPPVLCTPQELMGDQNEE